MFLYRIIASLIAPVLLALSVWRLVRGRETLSDLKERLGQGAGTPGAIWLHGASNGELTSARSLIDRLLAEFPGLPLVITANTGTARDLVAGWGLSRVTARLAPLDYRWALARFRAGWRPVVQISLENEFWPNRIVTARVPVFCIAARMSGQSAARWHRLRGLAGSVLARITWLSAQDNASAARFAGLGLDASRIGPVYALKPGVQMPAPPADELARLADVFTRHETVLAASTHDGEEVHVLQAFAAVRKEFPALKLILAPRHPRRSAEISGLMRDAGLEFATRSKGENPVAETPVYLADTLGEMPLWYALCGVTFVGGSLVKKGGHTPFEPAQFGSAIVHGADVTNFEQPYAALQRANAAICVSSGDELATALTRLSGARAQSRVADAASDVLNGIAAESGGFQPVIAALKTAFSNLDGVLND